MRQFIAETNLDAKGCLKVEGKKFHYLSNVLRVASGDMIDVRLPDGSLQQMTVALINESEKNILLQAAGSTDTSTDEHASKKENCMELYLFQFIAKPVKMELIVRQATECGVAKIIPVAGKFSQSGAVKSAKEAASSFTKGGRWDRIIIEARQQSGSPVDTKVTDCMTVEETAEFWKNEAKENNSLGVVLYEQTKDTILLHSAVAKAAGSNAEGVQKAALVTGCEGGIAPEEIEILKNSGFIPVHFETNILRCETAALYGTAALQTILAEYSVWQDRE